MIAFFARDPRGENAWRRLIAPALAAVLLAGIVVLAVAHYATLLGVAARQPGRLGAARQLRRRRGDRAGWGAGPRARRPQVYATIGLGAHAITGQLAPAAARPP